MKPPTLKERSHKVSETGDMKLAIKQLARQWLGDRLVGSIEYYRFPENRRGVVHLTGSQ
jgi:hypothetical protein